jgi:diguanylate cyclase (GGDEF)-like protein
VVPKQINIEKIEQNLAFLNKLYDIVRIVDPVKKEVLEYFNSRLKRTDVICYDYWKNDKICDNCISIRAYHDNKSYIKLEQNLDVIMLVTAVPVETDGASVVVELLKNATDSMLLGNGQYNDGCMMHNVVCDINDLAIRDKLTSLYNRRFIDERLPVDIIRATMKELPLSVVFIDLDNLKNINDTYGHGKGDLVLKHIAQSIQNCIRSDIDWAARYGGDEFVVCLNNIDNGEAYRIAERIRNNIENIVIPMQDEEVHLTASLGVYTMQGIGLTAEEILSLADQKMYKAKKSGKNRIV